MIMRQYYNRQYLNYNKSTYSIQYSINSSIKFIMEPESIQIQRLHNLTRLY